MLPGMAGRLLDANRMQPTMKIAMTREELMRPRLNPSCANGLVSRSPTVAPSGRMRMKANQNSKVRETFVRK